MSARHILNVTGAAAYELLKRTYESSGVLPLKSVAGDALQIADLVKKFRTSKKEWQEFGVYVHDIVATIVDSLGIVDAEQTEIIGKLEKLRGVLNEITETIKSKQREGFWARSRHFLEHPDMIIELKKKVDDAVDLLKFDSTVKTEIKVDKTLKIAWDNSQKLSKAALDTTRSKLRYVDGASWDLNRVCLEHTRKHVIEEILSWVDNTDDSRSANILLMTGVAGAGKSTIAHSVAQHLDSRGQLVTSFFFDRETNNRNNPRDLVSTIATDLCRMDEQLSSHIARVIEEDERVAYAPISRQFDELMLKPCGGFVARHRLVIVLDALDEGCDNDLLAILSDGVPQLPREICFFVTTRALSGLQVLLRRPHVHQIELDIHEPRSLEDIALFVPHKLRKVAEHHELDYGWPGPKLADSFSAKAGGLFLWVSIICEYLLTRSDPTGELEKLVSASQASSVSAESKMDQLYTTILRACNWDDEAFVDDYRRLLGAAVASKTPLTLGALGRLYQHEPVVSNLTRRQLSPLLTGLGDNQPGDRVVRFLHQSFRDFSTLRASGPTSSPEDHKFAIDERAHSQTLALLCIRQMNRELSSSTPGIGYLAEDDPAVPGIPSAPKGGISEELWYACRFWVEHLVDVELPLPSSMLKELEDFLEGRLTLWMEVVAVYGQYEGISKSQDWVKGHAAELPSISSRIFNARQGTITSSLAKRLAYMNRLEEALTAARDGVEVFRNQADGAATESREGLSAALNTLTNQLFKLGYREDALKASEEALELRRQLAYEQPERFTSDLADAIHSWSVDLASLGRHEDALKASEETLELRRQLAHEQPERFTSDLADAIHSWSVDLASLGRREEALEAIEEAMKIRRQLATERPAVFTSYLANSIHALSVYLTGLGRHEEALEAIEEAVRLRRRLASERPAAFTPDLAHSVHELSVDLYRLGRYEEALEAIEEAVKIRRQLASARPEAFTPDLAHSIHEHSVRLYSVGRHEDALEAIEEAVKIRRQLATERPAAFTSHLAHSIHALAVYLTSLGRHEEALEAIVEAVRLRRRLASERPAAFTPDLAASIHEHSVRLHCLARHEEALEAIEEAVKTRRQLASERPAAFTPDLAHSVHELSVDLYCLGRYEEALKASEEAVQIRRRLASERPAVFTPELAESLDSLAIDYKTSGFYQKALETVKESVELYRPFAEKYPAKHGTSYSRILQRLDEYSSEAKVRAGALESPQPDATTPAAQ